MNNIITKKQFTAIKKTIGRKKADYTLALSATGMQFIAMCHGIIELSTASIGTMAGDIKFYNINIDKMAALVTKEGVELTYDDVNVYCDGMIVGDKKNFLSRV